VNDCDGDKQQIVNKDYKTQPINKKTKIHKGNELQMNVQNVKHKLKMKQNKTKVQCKNPQRR
jgi:hypothetical protein